MNKNRIIFIKDTLCGWCRIASPTIEEILKFSQLNNIGFDFYHRRLFVEEYIPDMSANFLQMVERVGKVEGAKMTGITFSDKYFDLIQSNAFEHSSHLTSLGDAAAKLLAKDEVKAYKYAKKLQDLIFDEGLNPNDLDTIRKAAEGFFHTEEFEKQLNKNETVEYAIEQSKTAENFSIKLQAQGVPALYFYNALENSYTRLDAYNGTRTIELIKKLNLK